MAKTENKDLNVVDVQEQMKAMLEAAKLEAERMVNEARKSAAAIMAAADAEKAEEKAKKDEAARKKAEEAARQEEYVEVFLFKDTNKYKDDVFVSVNGENCVIKRGERVKIKRKFAEVLDHSAHQDYETSKLIEQATQTKKLADL